MFTYRSRFVVIAVLIAINLMGIFAQQRSGYQISSMLGGEILSVAFFTLFVGGGIWIHHRDKYSSK